MMGKTINTHYISNIFSEDLGGGNVLIRTFRRSKGVLVPEVNLIMTAANMIMCSAKATKFGQSVFNEEQLRGADMKVH
jgi:hypothetical protein